ncbi:arginase [soil metagenome]
MAMDPTASPIVIAGSPTALGGHFAGMERAPGALRDLGLAAHLEATSSLAGVDWRDAGDPRNDPGWAADPDPRAKNRALISAYLPALADHVADALTTAGPAARLLLLGGDCTSHAGAVAGIRRARPEIRLGLVWFDAHGDFNTPDTTPSGNVWGMPFAMLCGRGDPDLLAACDAPSVREEHAALAGGQVLDETESRHLAASPVAQFGAGMLGTDAGMAAFTAWARTVAEHVDGWYIAFDLDAIDAAEGLAVAMPESGGLSVQDATTAVGIVAATGPVVGLGATAAMFRDEDRGGTAERTVRAIAALTAAALGSAPADDHHR